MTTESDDWSDYESGPFCAHWREAWEHMCKCGHLCMNHGEDYDKETDPRPCNDEDCECKAFEERP